MSFKFLKIFSFLLFTILTFSCKDEVVLNFTETNIAKNDEAVIEINIPKAEGKTEAAKQINATLTHFTNTALNIDTTNATKESTEESIQDFIKAYKEFKTEIGKTLFTELPIWEVLIDGEIIYKNESIISIAMNSSINTGGAHGNLVFQFFNFDTKTGKQLNINDLINDIPKFTELAKKWYDKEMLSASEDRIAAFEKGDFKLPENLGFNDDGVIIFYDTFNTSSNNVIEFTIPYQSANTFLNF